MMVIIGTFEAIYRQKTTEEHRPSLNKTKHRGSSIGFYASQQHVKTLMLLYSVKSVKCGAFYTADISSPFKSIQSSKYSGGLIVYLWYFLDDLDLPQRLAGVCVKDHNCCDPVEKLYCSCENEPICFYCNAIVEDSPDFSPQCKDCDKPKVARPKSQK